MESSIVITGSGIISAIGCDKNSVLQSLLNNQTGIGSMKYLESIHNHLPVGEVKFSNFELKRKLGINESKIISRNVLLGAIAAQEAIQESNIQDIASKKVVFISGTTVGGMDVTESFYADMLQNDKYLPCLNSHDCGSSSNEIIQLCKITAEVCTISTACSSALNAIMVGAEMLKRGEADIVIAGGCESLSKFHFNGFNALMILDSEKCRPFDATRAGINLGEGAAYVVLERTNDAENRGANIQAFITGYGNRCDAFHQTATSEDGEGAYLAMNQALAESGLSIDDISYINAHGTGTGNNDQSESVALQRIFGDKIPKVSSTKGFTGHTTSASGSIETIICLLAMRHNFIPANLGYSNPMVGGIIPSNGENGIELNHVLCNSFGFGGNCSSMILSKNRNNQRDNIPPRKWQIIAEVEIDENSDLSRIKEFVPAMEARRMGKLLKAATIASQEALKIAGLEKPDAIITATALGMLETSEKFLNSMVIDGENSLSPTLFMQSTHNTIGSSIAIRNKCNGYNITYTQGEKSFEWAMRDAIRLVESRKAESVLVGCYDESAPIYNSFIQRLKGQEPANVYSKCLIISSAN